MANRYHLAKVAIASILTDRSFVDPRPDADPPSTASVLPHALALADSLIEAFGVDKVEE
ncbi:MAG: hypothetical protein [Caudoviricetes sp.]|nr:MAG: hypothetical protein [Caudoviricetes sp.]